jgi:hypothetical protein
MPNNFKTIALVSALLGIAGIVAAQSSHYDDGRNNGRNDDYRYDNRPYPNDGYRYQNRSYDDDDYRYDNGYRNRNYDIANLPYGLREARVFGFRDGESVARQDLWTGTAFDPNPRGRFDGADDGYRPEFGSKSEYREQYIAAYQQAYRRSYRRNDRY